MDFGVVRANAVGSTGRVASQASRIQSFAEKMPELRREDA
jgi:hypothetical protein